MLLIPLDGRFQSLFERHGWAPPQLAQLTTIHRVAAIMPRSILHQSNEVTGFTKLADNLFSHGDIFPFIASADIVDLPRLTAKKYMLDRRTMVLHCQPIAALTSISIKWKGLVVDRIGDKEGNEFLRVLIRPIGIAATSHHHGKPISRPVAEGQEVSTSFAGRIGTARGQAIVLGRHPGLDTAVHFVCADLEKSLQAGATSFLKQHASPYHIGPGKGPRIENRPIHVGLRRGIDHPFNPVLTEKPFDQGLIANVPMHKGMTGMGLDRLEICEVAGIFQRIQIHHLMAALHNQATDEMGADEAGSAGYEDSHREPSGVTGQWGRGAGQETG